MALVAHLGRGLGLGGHGAEFPRLGDVVAHRFLAKHRLAQLHGDQRRQGVVVVRRGDTDRIKTLSDLVEHHPVVGEHLEFGRVEPFPLEQPTDLRVPFFIRIHDRYHVVLGLLHQVGKVRTQPAPPASDLDAVEPVRRAEGRQNVGRRNQRPNGQSGGAQGCAPKKPAAIRRGLHAQH